MYTPGAPAGPPRLPRPTAKFDATEVEKKQAKIQELEAVLQSQKVQEKLRTHANRNKRKGAPSGPRGGRAGGVAVPPSAGGVVSPSLLDHSINGSLSSISRHIDGDRGSVDGDGEDPDFVLSDASPVLARRPRGDSGLSSKSCERKHPAAPRVKKGGPEKRSPEEELLRAEKLIRTILTQYTLYTKIVLAVETQPSPSC